MNKEVREFVDFVRHAPVSSGVCCCGDSMDAHGFHSGHAPVDQWEHSLGQWLDQLDPLLQKKLPAPPSPRKIDALARIIEPEAFQRFDIDLDRLRGVTWNKMEVVPLMDEARKKARRILELLEEME